MLPSYKIFLFVLLLPLCAEAYFYRVTNETDHPLSITLNEIGRWNNRRHDLAPRSMIRISTGIFCVNRIEAVKPSLNFINRIQAWLDLRGNACRDRNFVIRSRTVMRYGILHHIAPQPPAPVEEIYIEEV